jgi:hypothetical protein
MPKKKAPLTREQLFVKAAIAMFKELDQAGPRNLTAVEHTVLYAMLAVVERFGLDLGTGKIMLLLGAVLKRQLETKKGGA